MESLTISTVTPDGVTPLLADLRSRLSALQLELEAPLMTRRRHRQALLAAGENLQNSLSPNLDIEIRSEHLRRAGDELGKIVGRIDVEDLLDVIFSEFCIGK
ncbi:MAG: hypothetical protein HRU27_20415 [Rhizobiaceae bacterium]|nr:hypothetical protein [Rhizobiaceae bacterium]